MRAGRVILITGAGGGIGMVLVSRFLANGDTVIATDSSEKGLEALRSGCHAGSTLLIVQGDISRETDVEAIFAFVPSSRTLTSWTRMMKWCALGLPGSLSKCPAWPVRGLE